jgi:hypothetical protein
MVGEMETLEAWDLVELSTGLNPIGIKWVFKKKFNAKGKVEKHHAWLVSKGYSRVDRIEFGENFSPVVKLTYIRFILSIATTFDFDVEQMDVKKTFLHAYLKEKIYM